MTMAINKAGAINTAGASDLGKMPEWDLSDLYPGPDSPELESDLSKAEKLACEFSDRHKGKLDSHTGDQLAEAIAEYEEIAEITGRAGSYAGLLYAADVSDSKRGQFQQKIQERSIDISTHTLFFTLELNRLSEESLSAKLASQKLAHYQPWLRDIRAFREHQLSDEIEEVLHERELAGRPAWTRLFDETMAGLRFPVDGKSLTSAEALHLMSGPSPAARKSAAKSIGAVLGGNIRTFSLITNTLIKEKEIDDRQRHFARPNSSRNLANQVEDSVVDALAAAVKDSYGRLAHRYYALKAHWFGQEALDYWDRNAPLPDAEDRKIPWAEACSIVQNAYAAFSPELASVGKQFFDRNWIDAPTRPGKSPGAFAHPTVPSVHPYLLLNYMGRTRDVMTLAHELGHGVHQCLAGAQGLFLSDTPLTLAETASVMGEMMTFRAMLDSETDPARRRVMLASKVEDMLNTVVRQIAFHEFETRLHDERRSGELLPERIGEIWMEIQGASLGPAIRFEDEYRNYWAYIPHFVHSPFYVYAYAFGDCLVNSLYSVYRSGAPGFQEKYLAMLRAGGTLRHKELLAPFGLDATDPGFWKRGLDVVAGFIEELAALG